MSFELRRQADTSKSFHRAASAPAFTPAPNPGCSNSRLGFEGRVGMDPKKLREVVGRFYLTSWLPWNDDPDYVKFKVAAVRAFAAELGDFAHVIPELEEPANINNYFRIELPLTSGFSGSRFALDFDEVAAVGGVTYLDVLCSTFAPVANATWFREFVGDHGHYGREACDLLDADWLNRHPEFEPLAFKVITIGERHGHTVLGWDVSRSQADSDWPAPEYAPEDPQLRHFLFPGYYDD